MGCSYNMQFSTKVVALLLLFSILFLPSVNSQSYTTITSTSAVTTIISNTQLSSYVVGTSSATSTSTMKVYDGTFNLEGAGGGYCGWYQLINFTVNSGQEVKGSFKSTTPINFYVLNRGDLQKFATEKGCDPSSYRANAVGVTSVPIDFGFSSGGEYAFLLFNVGANTASVTLSAFSSGLVVRPSSIYATSTIVQVTTLTQNLSSEYTQQISTLPGGITILMTAALVVVAIIVAIYLMLSRRKASTQNMNAPEQSSTTSPPQANLPIKGKFCANCGAHLYLEDKICHSCGSQQD